MPTNGESPHESQSSLEEQAKMVAQAFQNLATEITKLLQPVAEWASRLLSPQCGSQTAFMRRYNKQRMRIQRRRRRR